MNAAFSVFSRSHFHKLLENFCKIIAVKISDGVSDLSDAHIGTFNKTASVLNTYFFNEFFDALVYLSFEDVGKVTRADAELVRKR